jgi:heparosan-N-sulfate-glucuronate 5-epimerase
MPENLRKASLYLRSTRAYWGIQDPEQSLKVDPGILGRYPLDLEPRLTGGHFTNFDHAGLPIHIRTDGRGFLHNYSTISGFGLGYWDRYLRNGKPADLDRLLLVADYIVKPSHKDGNIARLRAERLGAGHVGEVSALWQGESISVLCRAWYATKEARYLEMAFALVPLFDVPVEQGGVLGRITRRDVAWYEEYVQQPLGHVLNGMLVALLGLRDLALLTAHRRATELFQEGIAHVIAALPEFDTGFWSWYLISETGPPYIASMGYHILHVRLLSALAKHTGQTDLAKQAERFKSYARAPVNRCRAVIHIFKQKARAKILNKLSRAEADKNMAVNQDI